MHNQFIFCTCDLDCQAANTMQNMQYVILPISQTFCMPSFSTAAFENYNQYASGFARYKASLSLYCQLNL